jgi:hypothetical protein
MTLSAAHFSGFYFKFLDAASWPGTAEVGISGLEEASESIGFGVGSGSGHSVANETAMRGE